MAVKPDSCFSMASTKRLVATTKSPARRWVCKGSRPPACIHRVFSVCHKASTALNSRRTVSSQGTNSGRLASPWRSRLRLSSNSATSAAMCSGGNCACDRAGQAPGLHAHAPGLVDRRRAAFELPGDPQREADRGERKHQQRCADAHQLGGQGGGAAHGHRLAGFIPERPCFEAAGAARRTARRLAGPARSGGQPGKPLGSLLALVSTGLAVSQLAAYGRMNSLAFSMRTVSQAP